MLTCTRKIENVKRQRTDSRSASPAAYEGTTGDQDDSEDDIMPGGHKKSRNALRSLRERAERDERREEQERKRAEAASKRNGRATRRRGDGKILARILGSVVWKLTVLQRMNPRTKLLPRLGLGIAAQ